MNSIETRNPGRTRLFNILLIVASLALTMIFLELALRFTDYKVKIMAVGPSQFYYIADDTTGYDIAQNFKKGINVFEDSRHPIWSNELGCFDDPYNSEKDFIYLAGDSFTWGFAPFEDKWGTLAEKSIGQRILKCGVSGFGTKQELLKMRKILDSIKKDPKLIIIGYGAGHPSRDYDYLKRSVYDGYMASIADDNYLELSNEQKQAKLGQTYSLVKKYCMSEEPRHPGIQRVKCLLHRHSILYNLLKDNAKNLLGSILGQSFGNKVGLINTAPVKSNIPLDTILENHFKNLKEIKDFADQRGSRLLFVMIPSIQEIYPEKIDSGYDPEVYARVKAYLKTENIDFLDLAPLFRGYSDFDFHWNIDSHWNITGNHFVGLVLSKYLLENDFVSGENRDERLEKIDTDTRKEFGEKLPSLAESSLENP